MSTLKAAVLSCALVFVSTSLKRRRSSATMRRNSARRSVEEWVRELRDYGRWRRFGSLHGVHDTETLGVNFVATAESMGAAVLGVSNGIVDGLRLVGFSNNGSGLLTFQLAAQSLLLGCSSPRISSRP